MLFTVAWKNIWRSKTRSAIILCAITLGILGGLLSAAVSYGMVEQMVQSAVSTHLAHIQIHSPEYVNSKEIVNTLPCPDSIVSVVRSLPGTAAASNRMTIQAMAATSRTATGVQLFGIDPAHEQNVTAIADHIGTGSYFEGDRRNPAVIGRKLAEKLDAGAGSKIVFTFADTAGNLTGAAFRVVGIYSVTSSTIEESHVFVRDTDLQRIAGMQGLYHESAILLHNDQEVSSIVDTLRSRFPDLSVRPWTKLSPELEYINEVFDSMLYVFLLVIVAALAFGIVNTMLMAVLERKRELGMLLAVGMNHRTVFFMIMLETLLLSMTGAVAGMVLTAGSIALLSRTGIDLSVFAAGLREFGMASVLYPTLPVRMYPILAAMLTITAVLSSIYPAWKALKLKPAQALRTM